MEVTNKSFADPKERQGCQLVIKAGGETQCGLPGDSKPREGTNSAHTFNLDFWPPKS